MPGLLYTPRAKTVVQYDDDLLDVQLKGQTVEYTLFGREVDGFFKEMIAGSQPKLAKWYTLLHKVIQDVRNDMGDPSKGALWIHARVTETAPTEEGIEDTYKVPRWHQDGPYVVVNDDGPRWKYCLTVQGPGTQFLDTGSDDQHAAAVGVLQAKREDIAKRFENYLKIKSKAGQLVKCMWNKHEGDTSGSIHSEPYITGRRIFLAIVPLTDKEKHAFDWYRK
jgi:hypothetical protein